MKRPRDFDALTTVFIRVYAREHDITTALRVCFAVDDQARDSAKRLGFDAATLAAAVDHRRQRPIGPLAQQKLISAIRATARTVAEAHNLGLDDILGPSRVREVSAARREIYWRLRRDDYSMPLIALALNLEDHTSVLKGARKFELQLAEDPELHARIFPVIAIQSADASRRAA